MPYTLLPLAAVLPSVAHLRVKFFSFAPFSHVLHLRLPPADLLLQLLQKWAKLKLD
jgi:hypothetical protein